jgi:hypothetical protein
VQHYLVTDEADVSEEAMAEVRTSIDNVYSTARATGSLVTGAGDAQRTTADTRRPTLWFMQG